MPTRAFELHRRGVCSPLSTYRARNDNNEVFALRSLLSRYAPADKHIPIVSGEWGYTATDVSLEQQAQYAVRQLLHNLYIGLELSIWYDWRNDGTAPKEREHHFGTVYHDLKPKPAYQAIQTMIRALDGYRLVKRIVTVPDIYVLLFERGEEYALAAWTTWSDVQQVSLPMADGEVEVVEMFGTQRTLAVEHQTLELEVSQSPLYVKAGSNPRLQLEAAWNPLPQHREIDAGKSYSFAFGFHNPLPKPFKAYLSLLYPTEGTEIWSYDGHVDSGKDLRVEWQGRFARRERGTYLEAQFILDDEPALKSRTWFIVHNLLRAYPFPVAHDRLSIYVGNPSGTSFDGRVEITQSEGLQLESRSLPLRFSEGQKDATLSFPLASPVSLRQSYTIAYQIRDEQDEVAIEKLERATKMEDFDSRPPGELLKAYEAVADGDASVEAEVVLSVDPSPEVRYGHSAHLTYMLGEGWRFVMVKPKEHLSIEGQPTYVGMWVYGDKSNDLLRCRIVDAAGQTFQPTYGHINWTGWRYITMPLDDPGVGSWGGPQDRIIHYPIHWDSIVLVDSYGGRAHSGTVYVDDVTIFYEE